MNNKISNDWWNEYMFCHSLTDKQKLYLSKFKSGDDYAKEIFNRFGQEYLLNTEKRNLIEWVSLMMDSEKKINILDIVSSIESYSSFTLRLCISWANTYSRSDLDIEKYINEFILILLESDDRDHADFMKKNEAGEELEFLIELMKEQHIRHNIYKLT